MSLYMGLTLLTILCGLLSRLRQIPMPTLISTYAGDTLWALMVFWCFCLGLRHWKTWKIALTTILFSFAVELSQLYHAPWIDGIRHTRLGGLALGFGFKSSDLVCYSLGVLLGCFVDYVLQRKDSKL
jgi:hypothetical protein